MIVSVESVDAPHRIASGFINARLKPVMERLDIKVDLLGQVAGVKARRFWDPGVQPSQAATLAAEAVLADAGVDRSQIGVLAGFGKRTTSMAILEQKVRLARDRGHGVIFFYWEGLWGQHVPDRYRDRRREAFTRLGTD